MQGKCFTQCAEPNPLSGKQNLWHIFLQKWRGHMQKIKMRTFRNYSHEYYDFLQQHCIPLRNYILGKKQSRTVYHLK